MQTVSGKSSACSTAGSTYPRVAFHTGSQRRTLLHATRTHAAGNVNEFTLIQQAALLGTVGKLVYSRAQNQLPAPKDAQELRQQMASAGRSCMAVILPFAASTVMGGSTGGSMADLYDMLAKVIDIYLFLLTVRVLLTWFRNINWYGEPFRTLRSFTDPALNACRGIIPPIGGIDLSPMILFFGLNFAARQLKIMALGA